MFSDHDGIKINNRKIICTLGGLRGKKQNGIKDQNVYGWNKKQTQK